MLKETKMRGKHCPYCKNPFTPNPKVRHRQKTCGDPDCQKALKKDNNARWRKENPDYSRHDYPRVKAWLDCHPDYLKQYRAAHPEYVQKNREAKKLRDRRRRLQVDIQAKIKMQPSKIIDQLSNLSRVDIQDEIGLHPLEMTWLLSTLPCVDIQAQMDKSLCPKDNGTIEAGR
jgi:hypothetical protein